jgi:diguanylate cyclase (GGDEF)-like protein
LNVQRQSRQEQVSHDLRDPLGRLRTWFAAGLDPDSQRQRKGRIGGCLYLGGAVYGGLIVWQTPDPPVSQIVFAVAVAVVALVLMALPWRRIPDSVLIWPVLPSAFFTTAGAGSSDMLGHYQAIYLLALGYAGLVLRPGQTAQVAGVSLVLLAGVAGFGRQRDSLVEITGTILFAALIGEFIAAAMATQHRQRVRLEHLHAGVRPLFSAPTESEAARLVSELALDLLGADGVVTMVAARPDGPGGPVLTARGGAGLGALTPGAPAADHSPGSVLGEVVRSRQPLFVPDAQGAEVWLPATGNQESWASVLFLPIEAVEAVDQLAGVMVIAWTRPTRELDPFDGQVLELLTLQAGPVLMRVRQVEELDRAATTDPLTGVGNRRAFEQAMADLADDAVLVLFDLNDFKVVNDTRGHPAGDRVLRAFAEALVASASDPDLACRIGGDEFAVITRGPAETAPAMVERLSAAWTRPEGVGFSSGFAGRRAGETPGDLGARADEALYATKHLHRERVRVDQR